MFNKILIFLAKFFWAIAHFWYCSFPLSEISDSLTSLISSERPKRFAHGLSFVLNDLSELLSGSFDLSEMSKWGMSEVPYLL